MAGVALRPFRVVQRLVSLAAVAVLLASTLAAIPAQADTRSDIAASKAGKTADRPSPLLAVISLSRQRIKVYDRTGVVAESRVSTGMRGHRTPTGVFSILQRRRHHRSNIYSNAPMPYMQRLTWSGIALHAGRVPRYPASHGCIRLPYRFAPRLWRMTELGTYVVVVPDDTSPVPIAHTRLPTPRLVPVPPDGVRQVGRDEPLRDGPALASAVGTTLTDAAVEPGLAAVRLLSPLQRARAYKARARADAAATKRAARQAARTARLRRGEAGRAAKARRMAERALARAGRRHEEAVEALVTSASERARASARANAALTAAKAALTAARATAHEARLLDVVRGDEAAARADAAEARHAAKAWRRAEQALARARRRHERAVEAAKESALERAGAVKRASAALAAAEAALAAARVTAEEARLLEVVLDDHAARASAARIGAVHARRAAAEAYKGTRRIERPISIFVSRKAERVYIRHAWEPIHEAPVTFTEGPSLGTHVYMAMGSAADGKSMDWLSVSPPSRSERQEADSEPSPPAETAVTALERFELPEATRRFIADRLWAGAALIVSDHGLSHETGDYTDFIVLTR